MPVLKNNTTDNINYNPVISFTSASSQYMKMTANGCSSSATIAILFFWWCVRESQLCQCSLGKMLCSGTCTGATNEFLSFDVRPTYAINDSWNLDDNISSSNAFGVGNHRPLLNTNSGESSSPNNKKYGNRTGC